MMEIIKDPEFLRKKSRKVEKIDDETRELVLKMEKVTKEKSGIGLAACQIGYLKRVIIINKKDGFSTFINPVVLKKSKEKIEIEEGCLSIPDCLIKIKRPKKVKVKFIDLNGKEIISELDNIEARVFQHEFDHLNGILIKDRIPLFSKIKKFLKK